ncbi:hypothetical protein EVG20_g6551 [Dentipellis fragilis]|uniref:Reverse transcriptase zinc-binding domain-containing protein n=1 Tax=Dentipellis fragilis TaxID=205917 RepID=A0A4Y9YPA6_9AGAM|nr:hypothetical protein EVG20_g6551 [Dentipellis fragilis]
MTGLVPPWEGTRLYMARVDPHLIHGCDVILDIDAGSLTDLELLQCKYIRRLLGVSTRCSRVFLFTETGLVPLNYRRVLLSLGFLAYALAQPPERLVHRALATALRLARDGTPCWITDLQWVLCHLPVAVDVLVTDLGDAACVPGVVDRVHDSLDSHLQTRFQASARSLLLRNRSDGPPSTTTPCPVAQFRPYLRLRIPDHRVTLTRLVFSDHALAAEHLCWYDAQRHGIPLTDRVCRFCHVAVETPVHALLDCRHHAALVSLRDAFFADLQARVPGIGARLRGLSGAAVIQLVLSMRPALALLARFTCTVLALYDRAPIYVPPQFWIVE